MANKVIYTSRFARDVKPFLKKYPTFKQSLVQLERELIANPRLGQSYGHKIYKIRLADPSKGKSKSGGFRVITYVVDIRENEIHIYLITVFNKSEESNLTKADLLELLKKYDL